MSNAKFFVYMSLLFLFACGDADVGTLENEPTNTPMPGSTLPQDGRLALPPCETLASGEQSACETSIYVLKDSARIPDDSRVGIQGVVAAIRLNADNRYSHLVLQVPSNDPAYNGVDYSGSWIYLNNADIETIRDTPPAVGTYIQLIGSVKTHYDQRQLQKIEEMIVLADNVPTPEPVDVTASEIALNGARAWALEGSLVRIRNVQVTNANPEPGPGDGIDGAPTNEFQVDGGLIINDFILAGLALPQNGDSFSEITGILRYANNTFKLEPRNAADIR